MKLISSKKPITIDRGEGKKVKVFVEFPAPENTDPDKALDELVSWSGGKSQFVKWASAKIKTDSKNAGRNKGNAAAETATDEMVTSDVQSEVKTWVIGRDRANSGRQARDNNAKAIAALNAAKAGGKQISAEELLALLQGANDSEDE